MLAWSAYKWLALVYNFKLCGDKDETMNHISKYSESGQKEYKTRHDCAGKVIH